MTFENFTNKNIKNNKNKKPNYLTLGKIPQILEDLNRELQKTIIEPHLLYKIKDSVISIKRSIQKLESPKSSRSNASNQMAKKRILMKKNNMAMPVVDFKPFLSINTSNTDYDYSKKVKRRNVCTDNRLCDFHRALKYFKIVANRAHERRKIFTIFGNYPSIRKSLRSRGWIEKCTPSYKRKIQKLKGQTLMKLSKPGNEYEVVLLSKLMSKYKYSANFIWQPKFCKTKYNNKVNYFPFRNRVSRIQTADFTTKTGLIECINNSHWNHEDYAAVTAPRCFYVDTESDQLDFQNDYRMTICLSLLLFISEASNEPEKLFGNFGVISVDLIIEAIKNVRWNLRNRNQIGTDQTDFKIKTKDAWQKFKLDCDIIIYGAMKFMVINMLTAKYLINECKRCIDDAKNFYPLVESEGWNNIWIIKPAFSSRGRGIIIKKNYADILDVVKQQQPKKYIVQKYIERPLLIYKTKFDIRQYFVMMIKEQQFNVWMYKECYFKFCSQEFDLKDFQESVHLTNHAVQKKYRNASRSEFLPKNNMWTLGEFKAFLNSNGESNNRWNQIYDGMKKNIIAVVLSSIEGTCYLPNCFELFGCDFILDENLNPILIEINATPDMSPTTNITAKLCPKVLEDVIKIVVDTKSNSQAPTGNFEKIYQNKICKDWSNPELNVQGKKKPLQELNTNENLDDIYKIEDNVVSFNDNITRHDFNLLNNKTEKREESNTPSKETIFELFKKMADIDKKDKMELQEEVVSYLVKVIRSKQQLMI